MTDAPLIVFGGICLIAFGVVAFMVFRAVFQEINGLCDRLDRAWNTIGQIRETVPDDLMPRLASLEREAKITAATDRHLKAQALHRGEGSVQ